MPLPPVGPSPPTTGTIDPLAGVNNQQDFALGKPNRTPGDETVAPTGSAPTSQKTENLTNGTVNIPAPTPTPTPAPTPNAPVSANLSADFDEIFSSSNTHEEEDRPLISADGYSAKIMRSTLIRHVCSVYSRYRGDRPSGETLRRLRGALKDQSLEASLASAIVWIVTHGEKPESDDDDSSDSESEDDSSYTSDD